MKSSHWFILIMVLFLGVMFLIEYQLPKKFVWNPTFSQYDYQPFGCAIFDDVVGESWENDYYLNDWTFYNFANDTTNEPLAVLAIADRIQLTDTDRKGLFELAERGNKIVLVANAFSLSDTLKYDMSSSWFNAGTLKKYASNGLNRKDTLYWLAGLEDSLSYPAKIFEFYPQMCGVHFTKFDSLFTPLVQRDCDTLYQKGCFKPLPHNNMLENVSDSVCVYIDSIGSNALLLCSPVALSRSIGKGEIILITTPLLFTNYGVLDGDNATYIFRLLSEVRGLPLYRTEAYNKSAYERQSPFRYFLSQPALRWGLYLTMITILLFMIFTARRRQRPIPVVKEPDNKTLEFTELIGTLYFQKKNHSDLVCKKFTYFAETIRRQMQMDIEDGGSDTTISRKIANRTGLEEQEIVRLFARLRPIIRGDRKVTEQEMKECIDEMNKILTML